MSMFGGGASTFGGFSTGTAKPAAAPFGGGSSLFGSAAPTTSSFSSPFGFGGTPAPSTSTFGSSTFGSAAAPSTTFGGAAAPTSFGSTFGSTTGGFGQAAPSTTFGGAAAPSSFGTSLGGGNPFGASTSTPFGAPASTPFGSATSSPFGSSTTTAASTPFGMSTTANQPTSNFFGSGGSSLMSGATAPASSSPFGTSTFGATPSASTSMSPFGSAMGTPMGGFGGEKPTGTGNPPYQLTNSDNNTKLTSICAMDAYKDKSHEELRMEDYKKKELGITTQPSTGFGATQTTSASPFGTSLGGTTMGGTTLGSTSTPFGAAPTSQSPFGSSATSTPFGSALGGTSMGGTALGGTNSPFGSSAASTPFGVPSTSTTLGATASPFGSTTTTTNTSPFGSNALGSGSSLFGSSSAPSPFGSAPTSTQQTSAPTTLFGGASSTSPFGSLGATSSTSQPSTLFGQPAAPATSGGGLFGNLGQQPAAQPAASPFGSNPSLFGQQPSAQPATTSLGTPSLNLFGNTTTPASNQTSLFGANSTTPTLNLGGNPGTAGSSLFGSSLAPSATQPQNSLFGGGALTSGASSLGSNSLLGGATQPSPGGLFGSLGGTNTGSSLFPSSGGGLGSSLTPSTGTLFNTQTAAQPTNNSLFGTSGLGATSFAPQLGAPSANAPAPAPVAVQPQIALNNSIASSTPYFPVPQPPQLSDLFKSVPKASMASSASALSTKSYHTYAPRSTVKITPRRFTSSISGGSLSGAGGHGVEFDSGFASQHSSSGLQPQTQSFDRFVTKYSKALKINTAGETMASLSGSYAENNNDSGLGSSSSLYPDITSSIPSSSSSSSNLPRSSSNNNFGSSPTKTSPIQQQSQQFQQQSESALNGGIKSSSELNDNKNKPNPHAPKLTRPSYKCKPSIEELQKMSDYDLANVRDFMIERDGYGSVMFLGDVDVRGIDLDDIVTIRTREISIYPDDSKKPPVGEGLNRRSLVTLKECWPLNPQGGYRKSEEDLQRYKELLKRKSKNDEIQFIDYDGKTGSWVFRVEHFSKYSAPDTLEDAPVVDITASPVEQPQSVPKPKFSANITLDDAVEVEEDHPQRKVLKTQFKRNIKTVGFKNDDMFTIDSTSNPPATSSTFYESSNISLMSSPSSSKVQRRLSPPATGMFNPNATPHPTKSIPISFTPSTVGSSPLRSSVYNPPQLPVTRNVQSTPTHVAPSLRSTFAAPQSFESESSQVVPMSVAEPKEVNPFSQVKIDSKVLDLKVAEKDSFSKAIVQRNQVVDASLMMRRSFRVGWAPNGQLVVPSKTSIKTQILQKVPTSSTGASIVEFLKSHLSNSNVSTKENRDGWFTLTKVQEQLAVHTTNDTNEITCRIWKLVTALWGAHTQFSHINYSEEVKRRLNLNQWLKDVIAPVVDKEIKELRQKPSNYLDTLFSHLSGKQINESTQLASANKDYRLAVMMTQVWSDSQGKKMILSQLDQWEQQGLLSKFEVKRVEILKLISGDIDSVYKNLNDWYRCFAINFWYKFTFNSPLPDIINSFEESYMRKISTAPMPHYIPKNQYQTLKNRLEYFDTCFLLLKLFGMNRFDKFDNIFYPENVTTDIMDYSLSWTLFSVLQALPQLNKQPDINNQPLLHCSFAAQLERLGLWQWAVYVLSHIPDKHSFLRENAMKSLISRHIYGLKPDDRKFLTTSLLVPDIWIDECLSWCLGYEHKFKDQFLYMLKSGQYSSAHNLILEDFGPNYIITGQYNHLKDLLRKFQGHSEIIASWKFGGDIYLEFIYIATNIRECLEELTSNTMNYINNRAKLNSLATRAATLCLTISQIAQSPFYKNSATDLYRVSLSEISKRLIDYCQSAYDLLSIDVNRSQLLQTQDYCSFIKTIPLTEDYRLTQLNVISQQCQDELLEKIYAQQSN